MSKTPRKKSDKIDSVQRDNNDDFYTSLDIASNTECTGMVPTPPLDEDEVEGYKEIYSVPQQQAENAHKADSPKEQENRSTKHGKR